MSVMERLRELLNERGVEWKAPASYDGSTKYDTIVDDYWFHEYDGGITVHSLTPEQAIAATLGPGTCHLNRVSGFPSMFDARRCDNCWNMAVYDSKHEPKFCPYCGRRVVDE